VRFFLLFLFPFLLGARELVLEHHYAPDADQPIARRESPQPFHAVGLIADEHFHVRLRASSDGVAWTPWQQLELGHEGGSLAWFDISARHIEWIAPRPLRMLLINPDLSRATNLKVPRRGAEPEIVPRAGWGCGAECAPREAPVFADVTHLVVHHSAGANTATSWPAVIRSIWVLHVQGNGWNDIGYNFLIDPNGVIYEGRAGGDGVIGAHFSGVNTGTMGVCLLGTYSTQPPTAAAIASLSQLLTAKAQRWRLDPSGQTLHAASGLTLNVISGHRDAGLSTRASGTTECPGNGLYTWLPEVRRTVNAASGCSIDLARRNYCFGASGGELAVEFANPRGCTVWAEISASWITGSEGKLLVAPNTGTAVRKTDIRLAGKVIEVTQSAAGVNTPPCIARDGILNAASFAAGPVTASALVSVFGIDLATPGGRTEVVINSRLNATVLAATPNQVNFQLPAGVSTGSARLEVIRDGVRSAEAMFWVTEANPGIFVAQNFDGGDINQKDRPVRAGRPLIVYLTGIGLSNTQPWQVTVGNIAATGLYLGPTPGFIGLSQANLIVPESLPAGEHALRVTVSGASSPALSVYTALP
jgi:uncharacterized protein (TIGR03437 family)